MINLSKLYCGLPGQSDDLRYGRPAAHGPVVVFNCTNRCNLSCIHCYSNAALSCRSGELSTAEALRLPGQCAEIHCPVILFSGGEPLLRKDLFELLAEAQRLHIRTVLSTNGTIIDAGIAVRLAGAGVSYAGISIDGNEDFHDRFRKCKGAFRAAIAGLNNCAAAGLRTGIRFTITGENCTQIPAVFDIARQYKIRRLCFYHLVRCGRASTMNGWIPSVWQTRSALDVILDKTAGFATEGLVDEVLTVGNHADGPYLLLRMHREANPRFESARKLLIAAGGNRTAEGIIAVGPDGSVHPDQFWTNYSAGNVRETSLGRILSRTDDPVLIKLRNKNSFADRRCLKCRWFSLCKGNYRFIGENPADSNWLNEPACYLSDDEIGL